MIISVDPTDMFYVGGLYKHVDENSVIIKDRLWIRHICTYTIR